MENCAKCLAPVGGEAVFLRNGTYMCPACYQRCYPAKISHSSSGGSSFNIKGLVSIVLVIGLFYGAYRGFEYFTAMQKQSASAEKFSKESAEKRRREAEAGVPGSNVLPDESRRPELDLSEAERFAKLELARTADTERVKKIEQERTDLQAKRLNTEATLSELRDKQRAEMDAAQAKEAADAAQTRSTEIRGLAKRMMDSQRVTVEGEKMRAELIRKSNTMRAQIRIAQDTRAALLRQYNQEFHAKFTTDLTDVVAWRTAAAGKIGDRFISADQAVSYGKLVVKFDEAGTLIQNSEAELQRATNGLGIVETSLAEAKLKFDDVNRRLAVLNVSEAELAAAGIVSRASAGDPVPAPPRPPPPPSVTVKTILKKDGSRIRTLAIMSLEDEVRYKDEEGRWQTLPKSDVEKIQ